MEEHKDWGVVLQLVSETCGNAEIVGKWRDYCNIPGLLMGGVANCEHRSHTSVLFAFRWMLQQKINKLQLLDKYDWFILTRADELHLCEHFDFTTMKESDILLPTGEHYNGWSDRHLITRSSMFMKMINITKELVCRPDYWLNKLEEVDYELNIEVVQKLIWDDMRLTVSEHPRSIFIVRSTGDPASWSRGRSHPELSRFNLKVYQEISNARRGRFAVPSTEPLTENKFDALNPKSQGEEFGPDPADSRVFRPFQESSSPDNRSGGGT
ncbi:unnamed protein product [Adineta ricciae]|uniref:Uncharacterized protein n=1 Tax=Adineta ricciae TaxID=249248 RepID=A0A816DIH3_ADIRI|nr:unnamed protein product [Adineta ricciae]